MCHRRSRSPLGGLAVALLASLSVASSRTAEAAPALALSVAFEPRFGPYTALDPALVEYGFSPVASVFFPVWGLRGRVFFDGNLYASFAMNTGFNLHAAPGRLPTVQNLAELMGGTGYRFDNGLFIELLGGFTSHLTNLAATTGGGALTSLGPSFHPRVGYSLQLGRPLGVFLAVVAGANIHVPVGAPHANPLWEASFARAVLPTFTLGVEVGFSLRTAPAAQPGEETP